MTVVLPGFGLTSHSIGSPTAPAEFEHPLRSCAVEPRQGKVRLDCIGALCFATRFERGRGYLDLAAGAVLPDSTGGGVLRVPLPGLAWVLGCVKWWVSSELDSTAGVV